MLVVVLVHHLTGLDPIIPPLPQAENIPMFCCLRRLSEQEQFWPALLRNYLSPTAENPHKAARLCATTRQTSSGWLTGMARRSAPCWHGRSNGAYRKHPMEGSPDDWYHAFGCLLGTLVPTWLSSGCSATGDAGTGSSPSSRPVCRHAGRRGPSSPCHTHYRSLDAWSARTVRRSHRCYKMTGFPPPGSLYWPVDKQDSDRADW